MRYKYVYDKYGQLCIEDSGKGKILFRNVKEDLYLYDTESEARDHGNFWAFLSDKYMGRLVRLPGYDLEH